MHRKRPPLYNLSSSNPTPGPIMTLRFPLSMFNERAREGEGKKGEDE